MKIEEGAYYRTRGGYVVVGPLIRVTWCDRTFGAGNLTWREDGSYVPGVVHDMDLISEVYVSDTPPENAPAPEAKTLRDEFAFEAMKKLMDTSGLKAAAHHEEANRTGLAKLAYGIADAMMEAREK
jgi:hypothetical protein